MAGTGVQGHATCGSGNIYGFVDQRSGRALATGDLLGALKRVALQEDPAALAIRGITMARLGDFDCARGLLQRAGRGFAADAGTAFDGRHLFQIAEDRIQKIDPATGAVLEIIEMPQGVGVSGLESDGHDRFFCGGGTSGKVRAVRRPRGENADG